MMRPVMPACKNCGSEIRTGPFCEHCGQRSTDRRLNLLDLLDDVKSQILEWNLPWLYTIRELTLRPGKVCLEYVQGKRVRYVNPVKYTFYITAIMIFISEVIIENIRPPANVINLNRQPISAFSQFFLDNPVLLAMLVSPLGVLFMRVLYWKADFNRTEINSMVLFLLGHVIFSWYLINILIETILYLDSSLPLGTVISVIGFYIFLVIFYITWSCRYFFSTSLPLALIKSLVFLTGYFGIFSLARFLITF